VNYEWILPITCRKGNAKLPGLTALRPLMVSFSLSNLTPSGVHAADTVRVTLSCDMTMLPAFGSISLINQTFSRVMCLTRRLM
jgi:hypothetical protein